MNRTILIGRLGADPQVNYMPDGGMVANMRIATDESYKNQNGEKIARTEWHRVVTFGKLAEIANDYLKVGRLVCVEGKLRTRKWTDAEKIDRYTTEIVASNINMLDFAPKTQPADEAGTESGIDHTINADDVPF
jgi:single-strand DNA-binding protein